MDELNDMLHTLKQSGLSAEERDALRTRVRLFMDAHPAKAPLPVRLIARTRSALTFGGGMYAYRVGALASLAFIFVGVGTSYAAENALPGDPLYGVKIHVNEQVLSALATTPTARAAWSTQLATRRLEEAEALAATGKLTPVTASDLQVQISQATQNFDQTVASVKSEQGDTAAVSAETDMQATIDAHANVLAQIVASIPSSEPAIAPILADLHQQSGKFAAAPQTGNPARTPGVHTVSASHTVAQVQPSGSIHTMAAIATNATTSTGVDTDDATNTADAAATVSTGNASTSVSTTSDQHGDDARNAEIRATIQARQKSIELNARAWLKSAAGITLPPLPTTEIDGGYHADNESGSNE